MIASVTLTACGSPTPANRYQYRTVQDCIADWGDDDLCERDYDRSSVYYGGYWGPFLISRAGRTYYRRPGSRTDFLVPGGLSSGSSRAIGTRSTTITRGGFGGSSRSSGG